MSLLIVFYVALAVFVVANLARIARMLAMPAHLRWELYPVPHEPRAKAGYGGSYFEETDWWTRSMEIHRSGELRVMLEEIFLLKGVWKHNRTLWIWSWLFHGGLYLFIGAGILATACASAQHFGAICAGNKLRLLVAILTWSAMSAGTTGTVGILILRIASRRLGPFTSRWTLINLLIIISVFATGLMSLCVNPAAIDQMISFAGSLLRFQTAPRLHGSTASHVLLLALFMAYLPFTQMTHMYMKYFTYHQVRWDDVPYRPGTGMHASVMRSLGRPVSWAAPHIRGKDEKSWGEAAAQEVARGEKEP
jgi:nitrate reductase gamma subunit